MKIDLHIQAILTEIADPEIPVLSIMDMGVVRSVEVAGKQVKVCITPTYSGCPAMDMIASEIKEKLAGAGFQAEVIQILSPAWTTDWITEKGRKELATYGIAPPLEESADKQALMGQQNMVSCTRCGSNNTVLVSPFGSTACKALFKCKDCLEPFDYFKCLK